MFKFTFAILAAVLMVAPIFGKVYDRCSLAQEMSKLGVPRNELARWSCIAEKESGYNTTAVGKENSNKTRDYGIFQINNFYWCSSSHVFSYDQCNIKCADFLVDKIDPAVSCARYILKMQGWRAWTTWKLCNGPLASINDCFSS